MSSINRKNVQTSIPSYINRLAESLYAFEGLNIEFLVDKSLESFAQKKFLNSRIYTIKRNYILYRLPFISDWYSKFTYRKVLSKLDCEAVLIASDQDRGTIAEVKQKKIVVIHDLKGIKTSCSRLDKKNRIFYQKLIDQAAFIATISKFTKEDIQEYFNVPEAKIRVIYNSVQTEQNVKPIKGIPSDYILYVNALQPYKNLHTLIRAYLSTKAFDKYKIVIVGKRTSYWDYQIEPIIAKYKIQDKIIRLQNLSNEELSYVYQKASLFVTTSLHEGFGYTPIEAAMNQIPVICSTCEALPDTTQNLLNYYEPAENINALAYKIDEILNNPPSKERLKEIADKFRQDYSPAKQVSQFVSIFNSFR